MRLVELSQIRIRYGIQRLQVLLRREGWKDNHKRVYRIYCEEGLNLRRKKNKRIKSARNRKPTDGTSSSLHECWSMDFMSDALFDGKRFRLLTLVDNYSRKCLAIQAGISIKGETVTEILKNITFEAQTVPKRIKIDNGPEFISKALDKWAYEKNVELDFSRPGKPTDNAFIESFNGSLRDECLSVNWFLSLQNAQEKLNAWKLDYNDYRPHSSLGNLTPKSSSKCNQKSKFLYFRLVMLTGRGQEVNTDTSLVFFPPNGSTSYKAYPKDNPKTNSAFLLFTLGNSIMGFTLTTKPPVAINR